MSQQSGRGWADVFPGRKREPEPSRSGLSLPSVNIPGITRQEPTFADEMCAICPNLTYTQRIIGFAFCATCGYILSFMGTLMLIDGSGDGVRNFAVLYVFGNAIVLCGTGFLIGPKKQCKKMFHKTRRYTTTAYLIMLLVVFVAAVAGAHLLLVLFLLLIQCCCALWYSLSYIPYGRRTVTNWCCGCCKDSFGGGSSSSG